MLGPRIKHRGTFDSPAGSALEGAGEAEGGLPALGVPKASSGSDGSLISSPYGSEAELLLLTTFGVGDDQTHSMHLRAQFPQVPRRSSHFFFLLRPAPH